MSIANPIYDETADDERIESGDEVMKLPKHGVVVTDTTRVVDVKSWCGACWFSTDGKVFAVGGDNKALLLFGVVSGGRIKSFRRSTSVRASALSLDGSTFCIGDETGLLTVHSVQKELAGCDLSADDPANAARETDELWRKVHPGAVNSAHFIDADSLLAVSCVDGSVYVYNTKTGEAHAV